MKRLPFSWLLALLMAFSFASCSAIDEIKNLINDDEEEETTPSSQEPHSYTATLVASPLAGSVTDTDGNPLEGVTVSSGGATTTTNKAGGFVLANVGQVNGRTVVRLEKDGYFPITRSLPTAADDQWQVVMAPRKGTTFATSTTFDALKGTTVSVAGMTVSLPLNGYVVRSTGERYTGKVGVAMLHLDPNNDNFGQLMPGGDLKGVRTDASQAMLLSYGMTLVELTADDGQRLQLAEDHPATLTFPMPEGMDRYTQRDRIPLWAFNETSGLWEEQGEATLKNGKYVGKVGHFSWVNLDYPEEQATLQGIVSTRSGKQLRGIRVSIGQGQSAVSKAGGRYKAEVMAGEDFEVTVRSRDYGFYKSIVSVMVPALEVGQTKTLNITLPDLYTIGGRIVNTAGGTTATSIYLTYGNRTTTTVASSAADGTFSLMSPDGYKGAATLHILTLTGEEITRDITVGGKDIDLGDIEISAEQGSDGTLSIGVNGQSYTMPFPQPAGDELGGVIIVDNQLSYIYESESDYNPVGATIQIDGYQSGKSTYTGVRVEAMSGTQAMAAEDAEATIKRKDNQMVFDLSGTAAYYDQTSGVYADQATFATKGLTLNVFLEGRRYTNYTPSASTGYPDFAPRLAGAAPEAIIITASPRLGKGGMLYYNGSSADFDALLAQAKQAGMTVEADDSEGGYRFVALRSGKRVVAIEYEPSIGGIIYGGDSPLDIEAPLTVTALDSVDIPLATLFGAPRAAAPKRLAKKMAARR